MGKKKSEQQQTINTRELGALCKSYGNLSMIHNELHCFSAFNAPTTRTISSKSELQFLKA
jgi:hypothetical protein